MWFLDTTSMNLRWFNNPTEVSYAIVSHVWSQGGEQIFQDVIRIHQEAQEVIARKAQTEKAIDPDSYLDAIFGKLSHKIRDCCVFARTHGYHYVWLDTCCIDKTSSAELSEAINSMFAWYRDAAVCYVFLHDVSDAEEPCAEGSSFRRSQWFTRGWTLQELIAPRAVLFLSMEWTILGSKVNMADVVSTITGIDPDILTFRKALDEICVAKRMSWASNRRTTRVEDQAYCLLGIFGVSMSTMYGEGRGAFIRLQEEILKHIPDQTLFVWGACLEDHRLLYTSLEKDGLHLPEEDHDDDLLFASSPAMFTSCDNIIPMNISDLADSLRIDPHPTTFTATPWGVSTNLPLIRAHPRSSIFLAILTCQRMSSEGEALVALILRPRDKRRNQYDVGYHLPHSTPRAADGLERPVRYRLTLISLQSVERNPAVLEFNVYIQYRRTLSVSLCGKDVKHVRTSLLLVFPPWLRRDLAQYGYTFEAPNPLLLERGKEEGCVILSHSHDPTRITIYFKIFSTSCMEVSTTVMFTYHSRHGEESSPDADSLDTGECHGPDMIVDSIPSRKVFWDVWDHYSVELSFNSVSQVANRGMDILSVGIILGGPGIEKMTRKHDR